MHKFFPIKSHGFYAQENRMDAIKWLGNRNAGCGEDTQKLQVATHLECGHTFLHILDT